MNPKWRYFAGAEMGLGYLIYKTTEKKKGDVNAEFGPRGGVSYQINNKWGVKAEGIYTIGAGTITSSSSLKIMLGATYYLKD